MLPPRTPQAATVSYLVNPLCITYLYIPGISYTSHTYHIQHIYSTYICYNIHITYIPHRHLICITYTSTSHLYHIHHICIIYLMHQICHMYISHIYQYILHNTLSNIVYVLVSHMSHIHCVYHTYLTYLIDKHMYLCIILRLYCELHRLPAPSFLFSFELPPNYSPQPCPLVEKLSFRKYGFCCQKDWNNDKFKKIQVSAQTQFLS